MLLFSEAMHTGIAAGDSAAAVYRNVAPVFAQFRGTTLLAAESTPAQGTTLPVAVLTTALGTVNTIDNTTDMGAETLRGRGRAVAGLGWQPVSGSKKRHGVTRGKPPREHRKGLQKPDRTLSRPRIPHQGSRPFCMAQRQVAAQQ
ncbi:hypothetical protein LO763_27825 [Glycomyces sp. A-F 0318]|uniref:hypothetical protein n=1 Tax=Glycomyces amatae TaxID=2881355 RepID=UPI001E48AAF0|nr:hypothetical protein [Glycomyces amatae]MCD0447430.1 hypothetical protein [Glycomyces amatae]